MRCTWDLAARAVAGLWELVPSVQEDVLDEIEQLAADPSPLQRNSLLPATSFDIVRKIDNGRLYIFLSVRWDNRRHHLDIVDIGHFIQTNDRRSN